MGECIRLILPLSAVPLEEVIASVVMKQYELLRPLSLRSLSEPASERLRVNLIDGLDLPINDESLDCIRPLTCELENSR